MLGLRPLKKEKMINEFISVCKFVLVNPATSASGERLFSSVRRLKTWLRNNEVKAI